MTGSDSEISAAREPAFREIMAAVRRPVVMWNVPVHVCILIPATCFIAYLATRIDQRLGWSRLTAAPWNAFLLALLFPAGVFIVWYTYGYLAIKGEGSPASHLGGTTKLVTTGPFARCRHPSIIGKFLGVLGLGLWVGSPTFLFVIIPLLTTYSLLAARFLQERHCEALWGQDYVEYRRRTPLILPAPRRRPRETRAGG